MVDMAADILLTLFLICCIYMLAQFCTRYRKKHLSIRIPSFLYFVMRPTQAKGFTQSHDDDAQLLGFLYFWLIAMPSEAVYVLCIVLRIAASPLYDTLVKATLEIDMMLAIVWLVLTIVWEILIAPFLKE